VTISPVSEKVVELQRIGGTVGGGGGMTRHAIQTQHAPASPSYSQAVAAGNLVFVSGTVGRNMVTGLWPETLEEQAEEALKNLEAVLAEAGCRLDDVVKTTVFLTDPSHGAKIAEAYSRAFPTPPPARSAPVVSGFPIPEALISIEAIAVRPG
jgi:2-iminobutanoate/2-iminopropanoate deaminase